GGGAGRHPSRRGDPAARSRRARGRAPRAAGAAGEDRAGRRLPAPLGAARRAGDRTPAGRADRRSRARAEAPRRCLGTRALGANVPAVHDPRHGGRRQVATRRRVPRVGRRRIDPARPVPLVRRGDHVLARGRAPPAAARPRRRRGTRTLRARRAGGGGGARAARRGRRQLDGGDRVGGPEAARGGGAGPAARGGPRRPALGRADAARSRRACRRPGARRPDPAPLRAATVLLEPLSPEETDRLLGELLGDAVIGDGLRERVRLTAEGNPLFVEEMVAMLREAPNGADTVPPTIQALLAARLDQLELGERTVLERAAVEGRVFHRGAVVALAPEGTQVDTQLAKLVRKELVRPDMPQLPAEDAFRFRHLLIRDAAYDALPKAARAELHEQFAAWLDARATHLIEHDELIGYHLERAYRYRTELGPLDERGQTLG